MWFVAPKSMTHLEEEGIRHVFNDSFFFLSVKNMSSMIHVVCGSLFYFFLNQNTPKRRRFRVPNFFYFF